LMIKLYSDSEIISPFVFIAYIALKEKGLDFTISGFNLAKKENRDDESYQNSSITGRVPSIKHNDFYLAESTAIVEYIDEVWPEGVKLLPSNIQDRARARQIMSWLRSDVQAVRQDRPTELLFPVGGKIEMQILPFTEKGNEDKNKLIAVSNRLIREDGKCNLFPDNWCIADADLAFVLARLVWTSKKEDVPEKLVNFVEFQWQRPSLKSWRALER